MTETLIWKGSPSQLQNLGAYILCALFSWLVIPIFIAIWLYIKTSCTKFEITNERILVSRGVLNRITDEVSIYKVVDSQMEEPLLYRIVGLATITFFIVGDRTNFSITIDGIKNARYIGDEVRKYMDSSGSIMNDAIINQIG
ncbi:PH domain-containing protein [Mucilaginibacter galii]|uniref:YdbS-like PH domain-containing protein n=1 Tax=Mucilaginibacter galii TaxID=2005073 RepID=A0A917N099_9SPHI|nr:PH domain-containing protein [Mucilaginibacter galii]GGI49610.1 hypothetical protein GCM10011425_08220 [Mucilaginibacter galii]